MRPAPWAGELKERRGSHTQESHLMVERSSGIERKLWGIGGECSNQSLRAQSKNYVHGPCYSPAHSSPSCVSHGVEGDWVLESGVWRADPGRG